MIEQINKSKPQFYSEDEYYVRPKAAEKKIKIAQTMFQTVYIYGISGSGKTSFIKDYMGKRNYYYFSASDLLAQELSISVGGKKTVVVIDDLHLLSNDPFRDEIQEQIQTLANREDVWLILSGRSKIPSWLMHLYCKKIFMLIDENDLLFTATELNQYLMLWGIIPTEFDFEKILKVSKGVGVIMRLIAMTLAQGHPFSDKNIEKIRSDFWDYLDCHVYDQWDTEIHEFLLQVSIVDEFDKRLAEMISGKSNVDKMLEEALQIGNFMDIKEVSGGKLIYEIRLSMRNSMRRRLYRKYTKEKWERLYYNAGLYYELCDDIPNALRMYEACHDEERIANLLIINARKNPASGYYGELKKYYLSLSDDKIRESIELMAGMSMLSSMLLDVEESDRWYDELKSHEHSLDANTRKTARGWLFYLDIGLPHRNVMQLLDVIKTAGTLILQRSIILPEFSVTSNLPSVMNGGKDFCEWSKKDKEIAKTLGKFLEITLGKYGKGLLNISLAESFYEKGEDSYEIANLVNKGIIQSQAGGKIEQQFAAIGVLTSLHIVTNHIEDARELIFGFQKKVIDENALKILPNLETLLVRVGLYQGMTAEAISWLEKAPDETVEFFSMERYRYLTKVRIYLMLGKYEKALSLLYRIQYYSELMQRTYIEMETSLLISIALFRMGSEKWNDVLCKALDHAKEYFFIRVISKEGACILPLLKETTWQSKDTDFGKRVFLETEQIALYYPGYLKEAVEEVAFNENALKILKLQAEGLTSVEIADAIGLKVENIKYHNKQNFKKLGVNSKTAAVTEARRRKLI